MKQRKENLIVALVQKNYDLEPLKKKYKGRPIFVAGKSESEDKVRNVIRDNKIIVYDSSDEYFPFENYLDYISTLNDSGKLVIDLSTTKGYLDDH